MNQEIYEDRYKPTVPKVIDYGCIAVALLSFFYLAYKFQCVFWYPLLLLLVPFVLSRFPGRIYCDGETVAIQDPYHGTKRIPIEAITGLEIKVYAHQEGIPMVMTVHHFIYVMRIRTPRKTYTFKQDVKRDADRKDTAFMKLKRYIEAVRYIDSIA
ncbi:hypothetical protein [Ruminococcus sp.]|uniref:hypothetical protein n=1 Tax=Ruminococcus sp. TaxID=41978 RepID=UPI0025F80A35|nr:hypothetical protein [Ruminococcus sp.]MCI5816398.1 hypothetical protein [Ruminococcus sp.]